MTKNEIRKINLFGCFQQDIADCGVACLVTVMRHYGVDISLEYGRDLCGTNAQGTTMMGLFIAAQKMGFEPGGYETDFETLSQQTKPIIVHTILANRLQHYMVFCGLKKNNVIVFDPFRGISEIPFEDFNSIWSKKCLVISPKEHNVESIKKENKIIEFLRDTIKENKVVFTGLIIISLAIALIGMASSVLFQKLIDDYLPQNMSSKVLAGIGIVFILSVIKVVISAVKQTLVVIQYKEIQENLVGRFFKKLFSLKLSFFESRKIGDLAARLGDIRRIQGIINYVIGGNTVIDIFIVIVGTSFVGYYAWQMPILLLMTLVITLLYMIKNNRSIITKQREVMGSYSTLESFFINSIKNMRVIKVGNMAKNYIDSNNMLYRNYTERNLSSDKLQIKLSLFYGFINVGLLLITMLVCAYLYNDSRISIGEFIAISSIVSIVSPSIINLSLLPISYNEAKTAFDRFFGTIDLPGEDIVGCECPNIQSIRVDNLTFGYIGRKVIIDKFSAYLERGKINIIIGKSGSGKSTICKLLEKSYSINHDETILVNDIMPLNSINKEEYRDHIGIMPQTIQMFEGSIIENICQGMQGEPQVVYQRAYQTLEHYGLLPYFNDMPYGLMTIVGESGIELSGGEKQLVAFGRILVKNPDVFILDEPTASMDEGLRELIWKIIASLCDDHLMIVVTHQKNIFKNNSQKVNEISI